MSEIPAVGNPVRTRAILEKYRLRAKKALGQNFLTDLNVLKNIVEAAGITPADNVIEIGPGIGALTEQLAIAGGEVLALEIDTQLMDVLDEVLDPYNNVQVLNEDVLKSNLPDLIQTKFTDPSAPIKVVANLPYYITTPILMQLLKSEIKWSSITVMMQKEVAQRIVSDPGVKAYGALSLTVQYEMDAKIAFEVSRNVFVPAPNVDSAIVVLEPRKVALPIEPTNEKAMFSLIKGCFSHRRKSLWNNLQTLYGKTPEIREKMQAALDEIGVDSQIRPEQLSLEQFVQLSNVLESRDLR